MEDLLLSILQAYSDQIIIIALVLAGLTLITNVIVQVLKSMTWNKIPTNLLAVIIGVALTIVAFLIYANVVAFTIWWGAIVVVVVAGFIVAYTAIFGFDNLFKRLKDWWKLLSTAKDGGNDD